MKQQLVLFCCWATICLSAHLLGTFGLFSVFAYNEYTHCELLFSRPFVVYLSLFKMIRRDFCLSHCHHTTAELTLAGISCGRIWSRSWQSLCLPGQVRWMVSKKLSQQENKEKHLEQINWRLKNGSMPWVLLLALFINRVSVWNCGLSHPSGRGKGALGSQGSSEIKRVIGHQWWKLKTKGLLFTFFWWPLIPHWPPTESHPIHKTTPLISGGVCQISLTELHSGQQGTEETISRLCRMSSHSFCAG